MESGIIPTLKERTLFHIKNCLQNCDLDFLILTITHILCHRNNI